MIRPRPLELAGKLTHPLLASRVETIRSGEFPSGPAVVDLDPTTFCDLACPGCISGDLLGTKRFDRARLIGIGDELVELGVLGVVLIGGGEPLLHPAVGNLIERLTASAIRVGVVTNGTLIDRYLEQLAQCSWVRVSWDAADAGGFAAIRPSRSGANLFDRVVGNTALLARRVNRGRVGVSYMVTPASTGASNAAGIFAAADLAKQSGVDYFEIKLMLDDNHHVMTYSADEVRLITEQTSLARGLDDESFSIEHSSNALGLIETRGDQVKHYGTCPTRLLRATISPGGMYPCAYHRGEAGHSYGDPTILPIADLWERVREKSPDPRRDCAFHCARHPVNLELLADTTRAYSGGDDVFV